MNGADFESLRQDAANWSGLDYRCADDPRLIVRRRLAWTGYAVNMAHSGAWVLLPLFVVALLAPLLCLIWLDGETAIIATIVSFVVVTVVLIRVCYWEHSRERES